jgi:hypothetical protein
MGITKLFIRLVFIFCIGYINIMFQLIGLIAGFLAIISYIPYILDIIHRKVKPERASWVIWTVLIGIALFAQLSKGATSSLYFTAFDSIGAITIFFLSFKYGVGGLVKRDVYALIAAGIGLLAWYFTHNAIYALLITIGIDAIASSLTVIKTYEDPKSETYLMWSIVSIAAILAMISVGRFDLTLITYPFYIFFANFSVVVAKYFSEHMKKFN